MHYMDYKGKKTFVMPVGLPGSGKSTWIRDFIGKTRDVENWVVVGTDTIITEWAIRDGLVLENGNADYQLAFKTFNSKDIERELKIRIVQAVTEGKSIIFDQTNMAPKARGRRLRLISDDYQKEAVVFVIPDKILQERLNNRDRLVDNKKIIPDFVIKSMANSYVSPSKTEGFSKITYVRN